jgi:SAM-dependent methyltransferase
MSANKKNNYGFQQYWENRYLRSDTQPFEWYQNYDGIKHFLQMENSILSNDHEARKIFTPLDEGEEKKIVDEETEIPHPSFPSKIDCHVLIVGCGSSCLGEDMMKDGWIGGISNVDYSSKVLEQMNERYDENFYAKLKICGRRNINRQKDFSSQPHDSNFNKENKLEQGSASVVPKMKFEYADVTKSLPFPDSSFDLIIDKACMDSVLCSHGAYGNVQNMMKECYRVLKKRHGVMITISHASPENRLQYFDDERQELWKSISVQKAKKPAIGYNMQGKDESKYHYVYICKCQNQGITTYN